MKKLTQTLLRRIIIIVLVSFMFSIGYGQTNTKFQYEIIEDEDEIWSYEVTTDNAGNCYVIGIYETSTIMFGESESQIILTNNGAESSYDIFLLKYSTDGELIWAQSIGGNNNDGLESNFYPVAGVDIAIDNTGDIYITGRYNSESITFGEGNNQIVLNNPNEDAPAFFVAKFSTDGDALWAKSAEGLALGRSLTVDADGNSYVTGIFQPVATFGEGDNQVALTVNHTGVFIVKYSTEGILSWAVSAGGIYRLSVKDIEVDNNGDFCIIGLFGGESITFGEGDNQITLDNDGSIYDIYFAKYNNNGEILWARSAYSTEELYDDRNIILSLTTDSNGDCYFSGTFGVSSLVFGEGDNHVTLSNQGEWNNFFVKYTSIGELAWARSIGGTSFDVNYAMVKDENDNIYISGLCTSSSLTFGEGENQVILTNSEESYSFYVAKYESAGELLWARSGTEAWIRGLAVDNSENYFITGIFGGSSIEFGESENQVTLQNHFGTDVFIAKYSEIGELAWAKSSTGSTVGIDLLSDTNYDLKIYPNPNRGTFYLELDNHQNELVTIEIFTMDGKMVYSNKFKNHDSISKEISISNKGIYLIKIQGETFMKNKKVIIY